MRTKENADDFVSVCLCMCFSCCFLVTICVNNLCRTLSYSLFNRFHLNGRKGIWHIIWVLLHRSYYRHRCSFVFISNLLFLLLLVYLKLSLFCHWIAAWMLLMEMKQKHWIKLMQSFFHVKMLRNVAQFSIVQY